MASVVALQSFVGRLAKDELGPAPKNKQGDVKGPRPVVKEGRKVEVQKGQMFESNHPVVKAFPAMFGEADSLPRPVVEQATAAPGERRQR